jgi:hypothetical protein
MDVPNMRVRSYRGAIRRSVHGVRDNQGCEHAGLAEEDSFRLRELHASAGAFGCLAGSCIDGKMGPQLDVEVVLNLQILAISRENFTRKKLAYMVQAHIG